MVKKFVYMSHFLYPLLLLVGYIICSGKCFECRTRTQLVHNSRPPHALGQSTSTVFIKSKGKGVALAEETEEVGGHLLSKHYMESTVQKPT